MRKKIRKFPTSEAALAYSEASTRYVQKTLELNRLQRELLSAWCAMTSAERTYFHPEMEPQPHA